MELLRERPATSTPTSNQEEFQDLISQSSSCRVAELFAGVGGFHLGLERAGFEVVWANQWEPSTTNVQHAYAVYDKKLGDRCLDDWSNKDIALVPRAEVPPHNFLVGGFPCQDYSVAKPLPQATGIQGKKGVLWWQIYSILRTSRPQMVLLENVDRLLSSPASSRGRDFATILACLDALGYSVEWRVVNAADYGFPQRRRRVFIYGQLYAGFCPENAWNRLANTGVFATILPIGPIAVSSSRTFSIRPQDWAPTMDDQDFDTRLSQDWIYRLSQELHLSSKRSPFLSGGVMSLGQVWTSSTKPHPSRAKGVALTVDSATPSVLGRVLEKTEAVPEAFLVRTSEYAKWEELKGRKDAPRNGYAYSEGSMKCPDPPELPSRTIVTGEGGRSPSRFKHVVAIDFASLKTIVTEKDGPQDAERYLHKHATAFRHPEKPEYWRRLIPEELEELNGFERGWTDVSVKGKPMADSKRAFLMGNALVIGVVQVIGGEILRRWRQR
jgi:DNA (cytosine-5)-methyltransferase 1